jgi:hypothetical protein
MTTSYKRPVETIDLTGEDDAMPAPPRPGGEAASYASVPYAFHLLPTATERDHPPAWTRSFETLSAGEWRWALLSNYLECNAWLLGACPCLYRLPSVLIVGESEKPPKPWHDKMRVVEAPLEFQKYGGSNHAKFLLLFSATGVRVILTTANFNYHDARDLTQGVWTQDFPLKAAPKNGELNRASARNLACDFDTGESQFGRTLVAYLLNAWREPIFLQGDVFAEAAGGAPNEVRAALSAARQPPLSTPLRPERARQPPLSTPLRPERARAPHPSRQ